ncbi:caspase family protein [Leisingera sp. ANG-M7]|uniref:caspase family protein n=1 Tax=Leisingera sp. ANG-M7 TaxID=1577902 RepID=UPI00068D6C04|nr:caspase family protein [Leisingera sp. ANG-M7]
MKFLTALLFCLIPFLAQAAPYALIIGNDSYQQVSSLQRARSDARGYAQALKARGFAVTQLEDLDGHSMRLAIARFLDRIGTGDTVVFVYAGHGWSDGATNFLLPIDVSATGSETLIAAESFALRNGVNGIIDQIHQRGPHLTLAVIDACRNNPFKDSSGARSAGLARGLVRMNAPSGTFIAFSAGEGQTALDRLSDSDPAPYSVFTRHFLSAMAQPQSLQQAFKQTQLAVNRDARSVGHAQRPAYYDEVIGEACLPPGCQAIATPEPAQKPADVATPARSAPSAAQEWQDFKASKSVQALSLFAQRHAGTPYAALAEERIADLSAPVPVPAQRPQSLPRAGQPEWCPWAKSASEQAICAESQLWVLDAELNRAFEARLAGLSVTAQRRAKAEQAAWLPVRDRCGRHTACLAAAYSQQIGYLRR